MNSWIEIEPALPELEENAMSAAEIFDICKGVNDRNMVSTILSQAFKAGNVNRKEASLKSSARFLYWKKPADKKASAQTATDHVEQIKQDSQQTYDIPEFLRKSGQNNLAKAYVAMPKPETQPEVKATLQPVADVTTEEAPAQLIKPFSQAVSISMALDTLAAHLPVDGTLTICREGEGDNYRISLDLGAGDHQFNDIRAEDVPIALDAYATLQKLKEQS